MKIVPLPAPSELEHFARLFCRDFDLLFPGLDIVEAARTYLDRVHPLKAEVLRREIDAFLTLHSDMPSGVLGRFWRKLGAEYWPRGTDTRLKQSTGFADLDRACLDAVAGGRMQPAMKEGRPVDETIRVAIGWRLDSPR